MRGMNTYGRALSRKMSHAALLAAATLDHCQPIPGEEAELELPLAFTTPSEHTDRGYAILQ